jgi:hypothetical protein
MTAVIEWKMQKATPPLKVSSYIDKTRKRTVDTTVPITIPMENPVLHNTSEYEKNIVVKCDHYISGCAVECPECNKFFPCRKCHDKENSVLNSALSHEQKCSHQMDIKYNRILTNYIVCLKCNTKHDLRQCENITHCLNCNNKFGNYCCTKCILFTFDSSIKITHCDKCNQCNIVTGSGLTHCDYCGCCVENEKYHSCKNHEYCAMCQTMLCENIYLHARTSCIHFVCRDCGHNFYAKKQTKSGPYEHYEMISILMSKTDDFKFDPKVPPKTKCDICSSEIKWIDLDHNVAPPAVQAVHIKKSEDISLLHGLFD